MPYLAEALGGAPAILGFRSDHHAEAASLLPGAEVVVEPRLVTELLADDPGGRPRVRAGTDARGRSGARSGRPARVGGADGLRVRCVLRLRRRARRPLRAPLHRRPRPQGRSLTPILNASGLPRRAHRARGRARAGRVRDEDGDAACARGKSATPHRRDRERDAELDRPAEPGHRRLRRGEPATARGARRPDLGVRRRVLGCGLRVGLRTARRARRGGHDRAQPLVPERRGGTRDRRRSSSPPPALRRARRSTRSSRPRPGTSPSPLARSRPRAPTASPSSTRSAVSRSIPSHATPKLARGPGGYSGPALRPIALACVLACAEAVDLPIVGMGGIATGRRRAGLRGLRRERRRARDDPLLGPVGACPSARRARRNPRSTENRIRIGQR